MVSSRRSALFLALGLLVAAATGDALASQEEERSGPVDSHHEIAVPLFDLFSLRHTDQGSELHILRIPFFQLFEWHSFGEDDFELQFFRAPFITLFRRQLDFGYSKLQILDIPMLTFFNAWGDDDGRSHKDILGLPLIGSVYKREVSTTRDKRQILFLFRSESHRNQ